MIVGFKMSFYGSAQKAADLAGVDLAEATEEKQDLVNSYIDVVIRSSGFGSHDVDGEYYDIYKTRQNNITLENSPVIGITTVHDEANSDDPVLIDSDGYVCDLDTGILQLITTKTVTGNGIDYFTKGYNTVKVVYSYGFSSVPSNIQQFATLLLARFLKMEVMMESHGIIKSIRIGNYSESYGINLVTPWDSILVKMESGLMNLYSEGV